MENNENLLEYYKEAYEREKRRNAELTNELADAYAKGGFGNPPFFLVINGKK